MISCAIGVFGGTFDPVHKGHLQMALEAKQNLQLDEIRLIPCHRPPHRDTPTVSSQQRLHLLSLAAAPYSDRGIVVDDRELGRDEPSYSVDTLASIRSELGGEASLAFILGTDAFAGLKSWHQWERLRELAHLVVLVRPENTPVSDTQLLDWLEAADSPEIIRQKPAGGLVVLEQSLLPISATQIRQQLAMGQASDDLAPEVASYINQYGLYQGLLNE